MTRPHDVSQLTTAELETARRELRSNLGLITPAPPRTCRSWHTCRPSTPSLPDAPPASSPAKASASTARCFPARPLPLARRAETLGVR